MLCNRLKTKMIFGVYNIWRNLLETPKDIYSLQYISQVWKLQKMFVVYNILRNLLETPKDCAIVWKLQKMFGVYNILRHLLETPKDVWSLQQIAQ